MQSYSGTPDSNFDDPFPESTQRPSEPTMKALQLQSEIPRPI